MAILITNPTIDEQFGQFAKELAASCATPGELQSALRAYYPDAVVRPRGLSGERDAWYVYRDGYWVPSRPGEDAHDGGSPR